MERRRCTTLLAVILLARLAAAQQPQQPQSKPAAAQPVIENYYKIAPGRDAEWLELYRKWHLPILKELQKEGRLLSITIYKPQLHQGGPEWHYKVLLRYPSFAVLGDEAHQQGISKRLYPDQEALRRNEQRRWEITERHWDDLMVEVPQ